MVDLIRAFIAIELSLEIKAQLGILQERLKQFDAAVKWVKPDSMHLTLKFLGNISTSLISPLKDALETIGRETTSFQITLSKIGTFGKTDHPRVIWVGVKKGEKEILEIKRKLEERLEKIGIPLERRPYHVHLTLGRMKSSKNKELKKAVASLNADSSTTAKMTAFNVQLFKSAFTPKGAIHTCLGLATFTPTVIQRDLPIKISTSYSSTDR